MQALLLLMRRLGWAELEHRQQRKMILVTGVTTDIAGSPSLFHQFATDRRLLPNNADEKFW